MQEVVRLKTSVTHIEGAARKEERMGVSFFRFLLLERVETVTTDRLYVSEEAVRCLNEPLR
ncbi:MAG: hypothetical protein JRN45_00515 [Nitrososphaerota archaeon]|nr:hypothetical protein [Nitrososphaerota archaeon]